MVTLMSKNGGEISETKRWSHGQSCGNFSASGTCGGKSDIVIIFVEKIAEAMVVRKKHTFGTQQELWKWMAFDSADKKTRWACAQAQFCCVGVKEGSFQKRCRMC